MNSSETKQILAKDLVVGWDPVHTICKIAELRIKPQTITVLCGPNGVGKSTLLKTIAVQIPAIGGSLSIDGADISTMDRKELARKLAYVPQFSESRRSLSVEEWVVMGRNPHQDWWSWSMSKKDQEQVELALTRTSCMQFRKQNIDTLSGGERQRVAIATALAQEPSYILLDEPTAHLDFRHQLELMDLLKQLAKEGLGILVVMHDLNLTARLADEVLLLKKLASAPSEIAACGPVDTVLTSSILQEVYGVEVNISNHNGVISYVPTRCT